jgi:uncharacterized iron-regulated membrane protein
MVVIGISGSALVLQREILARSAPAASSNGERKPIPAIIAAAQSAAPKGRVATRVDLPSAPGRPAAVRFSPSGKETCELDFYVDPVSLKVLGSEPVIERGPVLAFLITIHAFLAVPPPIGLPLSAGTGLP